LIFAISKVLDLDFTSRQIMTVWYIFLTHACESVVFVVWKKWYVRWLSA